MAVNRGIQPSYFCLDLGAVLKKEANQYGSSVVARLAVDKLSLALESMVEVHRQWNSNKAHSKQLYQALATHQSNDLALAAEYHGLTSLL